MSKTEIKIPTLLTYCGTLPLIAAVLLKFFMIVPIDAVAIAKTYGAIIIAFLCGIHWAINLFFPYKTGKCLFISSNIVALIAWGCLWIENTIPALCLELICFVYLLRLDIRLNAGSILPDWFMKLRRNASLIVIACLSCLILLS